ncbi:MAG TPA: TonB C-terminal domain-containing protein [Terracidiphilus sp.]|nr:TonB C-terminal domain-containing protein [Terracidiphilus sp.]
MDSILEGTEQLERELTPEPITAPAAGSLILHAALFAGVLAYGIISGFIHHNFWGNPGPGSAIQVSLDSSAIPLPSDQPKNENVLPTEKPSPAPAPPAPKAKQAIDETAIPIQGKEKKLEKQKQIKTPKMPPPKPDSRVQYGEQAGSKLSRSTYAQAADANQPVSVSNGDFGSRFPWYVDGIKRKVSQNWIRGQVDPRTPKGASVQIYFKISRQGTPSGFRINTASGSPTLDRSCLLATQRVDTFGDLPRESNDQWLDVTYDCTY